MTATWLSTPLVHARQSPATFLVGKKFPDHDGRKLWVAPMGILSDFERKKSRIQLHVLPQDFAKGDVTASRSVRSQALLLEF